MDDEDDRPGAAPPGSERPAPPSPRPAPPSDRVGLPSDRVGLPTPQRVGDGGGRVGPRVVLVPVALLGLVVALALLGPSVAGPPRDGRASPMPRPTVAATAAPTIVDPYAGLVVTCGYPSGWRVATLQHWWGRTGTIRTWSAVDPVTAGGPTDPAIPFVIVATDVVTAIGYCSPLGDTRPPTIAGLQIWALGEGDAREVELLPVEPRHPNALGGLWGPPPAEAIAVDGFAGWRPGRYVVRVRGPAFDRWMGVEIQDISDLRSPGGSGVPTTAPEASPAAS